MDNYKKYLKYKKKYLELKESLGGSNLNNNNNFENNRPTYNRDQEQQIRDQERQIREQERQIREQERQIREQERQNQKLERLNRDKQRQNRDQDLITILNSDKDKQYSQTIQYLNTRPTHTKEQEQLIREREIPIRDQQTRDIFVDTEFNSGMIEGMRNQCFWISIQQYLIKNGVNISVRQLRSIGGLDSTTETKMFDSSIEQYRLAGENVALNYNLKIIVYPVTSKGKVLYNGNIVDVIGSGDNIVNIAQFGTYHFQLITRFVGQEIESRFQPAALKDNNIVFDDGNDDYIHNYILLIDTKSEIKQVKDTLEILMEELTNIQNRRFTEPEGPLLIEANNVAVIIKESNIELQKLNETEERLTKYLSIKDNSVDP